MIIRMRQETISRWLTNDNGSKAVVPYSYFYLGSLKAIWMKDPPSKITWKISLRLDICEILLCTNTSPSQVQENIFNKYDSFLKSHLQKAIRRRKVRPALYTADLLLSWNPLQLLRRLTVIMVEDAWLSESFPTLLWFMCALSKGYVMRKEQKEYILGVVYLLATGYEVEIIPESYYAKKCVWYKELEKIHAMSEEESTLLYSLRVRSLFGGLKGDIAMFQAFLVAYLDRMRELPKMWYDMYRRKVLPIYTEKIKMKQDEWLLSAFDFHVSPGILFQIEAEYPERPRDVVKDAIWFMSSSLNDRVRRTIEKGRLIGAPKIYVTNECVEIWREIKIFIRRKAWGYVQRMIEDLSEMYPERVYFVKEEV